MHLQVESKINDKGKYIGLITGQIPSVAFDNSSLLVKPGVAKKQIEEERAEIEKEYLQPNEDVSDDQIGEGKTAEPVKQEKVIRRFHGSVRLDNTHGS